MTYYKFTDQEHDAETGLYNYNARLYDPAVGIFISPDSIVPDPFDPQMLNRYSYVRNNPLKNTDPTGHSIPPDVTNPMAEIEAELDGPGNLGPETDDPDDISNVQSIDNTFGIESQQLRADFLKAYKEGKKARKNAKKRGRAEQEIIDIATRKLAGELNVDEANKLNEEAYKSRLESTKEMKKGVVHGLIETVKGVVNAVRGFFTGGVPGAAKSIGSGIVLDHMTDEQEDPGSE